MERMKEENKGRFGESGGLSMEEDSVGAETMRL